MEYAVRTFQLTKTFNGKNVVERVNMNIKAGEIYGFLGPNGAGKTTIMKMLTNLIKPSEGEIEIFGEKLNHRQYEALRQIGSIIEYPFFYDHLTAKENLEIHCKYLKTKHIHEIDEVLAKVNLHNTGKKKVKEFSLGMKQRLGIARAIITKPKLLILDEPINGLDPVGIREMRDLMRELSREHNITILISSHILAEIEQIADTIGVISDGKLITEVTMQQMNAHKSEFIELAVDDSSVAIKLLAEQCQITDLKVVEQGKIHVYDMKLSELELSKKLLLNNVNLVHIQKHQQSLEDYFLTLINGGNKAC